MAELDQQRPDQQTIALSVLLKKLNPKPAKYDESNDAINGLHREKT